MAASTTYVWFPCGLRELHLNHIYAAAPHPNPVTFHDCSTLHRLTCGRSLADWDAVIAYLSETSEQLSEAARTAGPAQAQRQMAAAVPMGYLARYIRAGVRWHQTESEQHARDRDHLPVDPAHPENRAETARLVAAIRAAAAPVWDFAPGHIYAGA